VALSKSEKERIVGEVKEVASNASSLVISDARVQCQKEKTSNQY
jgi:ribosomal protein L10